MASVSVAVNFFENFQYYVSQHYHDLHGECEDCQATVPEWELEQCQLGFCGRFFCRSCGFRCDKCENSRDPRSVCLCTVHARSIRPFCTSCRKNFCDLCTTVTLKKCCSCLGHFCSECQQTVELSLSRTGTCNKCDTKVMRSLQDICRTSIRRSLLHAKPTGSQDLHPLDIDKGVEELPIPGIIKNFVCYR